MAYALSDREYGSTWMAPIFQDSTTVIRQHHSVGVGEVVPFPQMSEFDRALSRLRQLRGWGANWDGEGAVAPAKKSVDLAIKLLALLQNTDRAFAAHLDSDSRPILFLRNSSWLGDITIENPTHISYCFEGTDERYEGYDVPFDGAKLPNELFEAINLT